MRDPIHDLRIHFVPMLGQRQRRRLLVAAINEQPHVLRLVHHLPAVSQEDVAKITRRDARYCGHAGAAANFCAAIRCRGTSPIHGSHASSGAATPIGRTLTHS